MASLSGSRGHVFGWGVKKRVPPDKEELIEEERFRGADDMSISIEEDDERELLFGGNGEYPGDMPRS